MISIPKSTCALVFSAQALARTEHCPLRRARRREFPEPEGRIHVVVDCLHSATNEISLVPETGSSGIADEILPALLVRDGPRPGLERIEIASVLAHPNLQRKDRKNEGFMQQQSGGFVRNRARNSRAKPESRQQPARRSDLHAQIDDNQVRKTG